MIRDLDTKSKTLGVLLLVVVGIDLIQMTPFAPLPQTASSFFRGFAVGLAIAFAAAIIAVRAAKPKR
jgi:hypothetical protein